MAIRTRRRNRTVVPFKGKLYQYVLRDFGNVPITNAKGQKVVDSKGKTKTAKRQEISDLFTVYAQMAEFDQYALDIYTAYREVRLAGQSARAVMATRAVSTKFTQSWKYFVRVYGHKAPRGFVQLAKLIVKDLGTVDMQLAVVANKSTKADDSGNFDEFFKSAKFFATKVEFKRGMENLGLFLQEVFKIFGMVVETTPKTNPKMRVKYLQFELGDEIEQVIQNSSEGQAEEIKQAQRLVQLQKDRLKASLEQTGDLIETVPYYFENGKPPVFLTVTYDPRITRFPKPKNQAKKVKFTAEQKDLILNLESVTNDVVYGNEIDPNLFFTKPINPDTASDEEKARHQALIAQISQMIDKCDRLAVPVIVDGYGDDENGNPLRVHPEGSLFAGKAIRRYTIPKKKRTLYKKASKVFDLLLMYHDANYQKQAYRQQMKDWSDAVKPLITGIYHEDFTLRNGGTYKKFTDFDDLAEKVDKSRRKKERARKDSKPQIKRVKVPMTNVEVWDSRAQKMVRKDTEIEVTEFTYGKGRSTYQPPVYTTELQNAIDRMASGEKPRSRMIKDGNGDEQFGITKAFKVMEVIINGKKKDLIVSGIYAGYTIETVLNMEGRFLEGGYFQNGRRKEMYEDRIKIVDGEVQTFDMVEGKRKSRLIEPYITVDDAGTGFILGLPSAPTSKNDRNLMSRLSDKNTLITKEAGGIFPFYSFPVSEFNAVRETLGSVALSRPAQDLLDAYNQKLIDIELSSSEENSERFHPRVLGGFVERVGNHRFNLNNKQREACAWLDASGMSGVVALDTGVGKTLTAVASIKNAINQEMFDGLPERRFLFVSPSRLVGNLEKEIRAFMVEGGEQVTLEDGSVDTTPNWKEIMLQRVDEMSYEDYLKTFMDIDNKFTSDTEYLDLIAKREELTRQREHNGKTMTLTYDGDTLVSVTDGDQISRTASLRVAQESPEQEASEYTQKVVTYPSITKEERADINKQLREIRKQIKTLEASVASESFPKADKHFQSEYYCCFFDEVNEIFESKDKSRAMSALKHPRKVFLTASAMEKDPADLYKFVTLSKGGSVTQKGVKDFASRYGNVVGGKFIGLKQDPDLRREFLAWVKENTFFSVKTDKQYDKEMGVEYFKSGLPTLKKLQTTTYTVQMPKAVRDKYKETAKEVSRELEAMLKKYRDMRGERDTAEESDVFYEKDENGRIVKTHRGRVKKLLKDYSQMVKLPAKIQKLISLSNQGNVKSSQAMSLFQNSMDSRFIYFSADPSLLEKVIKGNSNSAPLEKIHVLCLDEEMRFYRRGEIITAISANDNMSVDQFKANLESQGLDLKSASIHKVADEDEEETTQIEASWAIKISKEFIRDNPQIATIGCTDAYARGFNFQTFQKVVHLDRGAKFDSELIKQRTARAYRGGQADQVEEIFIDATLTSKSETKGSVSTSAIFKDKPLKNATSLCRAEIKPNVPYFMYAWDEGESKWEKVGDDPHILTCEEEGVEITLQQQASNRWFDLVFDEQGYVKPAPTFAGEGGWRRIVIPADEDPGQRGRVAQGMEAISIDQLKSIVNQADQEFFSEIISSALSTDLIDQVGSVDVDTGKGVTVSKEILRSVIDPTAENVTKLVEHTQLMEDEPIRYLALSATQWEDNPHLSSKVNRSSNYPEGMIPESVKKLLNFAGGGVVLDSATASPEGSCDAVSGTISTRGPFGSGSFQIRSNHIYNSIVQLNSCAPKSYSSRFIFSQVLAGIKGGKSYISCQAAGSFGSSMYCGYAVWPKFGFDVSVSLPEYGESTQNSWFRAIRQVVGDARTISILDLYSISADIEMKDPTNPDKTVMQRNVPCGELWWARYGSGRDMVLSFDKGSKSMKILNRYLKRKAQEANLSVQEFLQSPVDPFNLDEASCWIQFLENTYVQGKRLSWKEVVRLYPDAFKVAWYSSYDLRVKVKTLAGSESNHESFLKRYKLVDPNNTQNPPPTEDRVNQAKERFRVPPTGAFENPVKKMGSEDAGDMGLMAVLDDPILKAVWSEIRAENRYNLGMVDLEENSADPDLITIERMKKEEV